MYFTKAMLIHFIDGKCHINLFNQSHMIYITPYYAIGY